MIAYDLRFQGQTRPGQDRALIEAVSDARPVVLATFDPDGKPIPVPAGHPDPEAIGAMLASIGVPTDSDGEVRKLLYPPIKLRTLPVEAGELQPGGRSPASAFDENEAWVDFAGPPGTYPTYSLIDVVRGEVPDDAFDGKLVIVGPTDPAAKDLVQTPTSDSPMPGPEFQANSMATVLDGFPLRSASDVANVRSCCDGARRAAARAAALGAPGAARRRGRAGRLPRRRSARLQRGRIVHVAAPVLGLLIGTAGALIVHYALVTRERRHLRSLFSRFVPPRW